MILVNEVLYGHGATHSHLIASGKVISAGLWF